MRLIPLLACLVLAACQAQPTPAPSQPTATVAAPIQLTATSASAPLSTPTPTSSIPVRAADLRGLTLSVWHPLGGEQARALKTIAQDFNQNNIWGIQVEMSAHYSLTALEEQLTSWYKDGKLPQVALAPSEVIADWQVGMAIIAEAAPYIQDADWGLASKESADIPAIYWPASGERSSVPILRNASLLFYNQSWAQELGYNEPPGTPEAFRAQACAASRASLNDERFDNDGQGGWFLERDPLTLLSWMETFNANPVITSTGAIAFNTTAAANTFTFLRKLLDSACAWTSKTASPGEVFSQRRALFYSGTLENLLSQERIHALNKSADRWSLLAYPAEDHSPTTLTDGMDGAILRGKPAEQLASWLFLRWLLLPRSQAALASAGATLPVRTSALELMADFGKAHPQWAGIAQSQTPLKPAPPAASWRIARRILEDAAWQIFQPYVAITRIPAILAEMDTTFEELIKRQP